MFDPDQYFPTPRSLALRAWATFSDRDFGSTLEPSAGEGHLAAACPSSRDRVTRIDCIERDLTRHEMLRARGLRVIGLDFLSLRNASMYSKIIMNPPFAEGVRHVLHAWSILWDGEIVAILNAETVRNPCSQERKYLVDLIARHGQVEFIEGAFESSDALRKTRVDVALVHFTKHAEANEILGDLLARCRVDSGDAARPPMDTLSPGALPALPVSRLENAVVVFDAAVLAMRKSVLAEACAAHYARLIGGRLEERHSDASLPEILPKLTADWVREHIQSRYKDLKNRAWASVLDSTEVRGRLSIGVRQSMERQFQDIQALEFTLENIYAFLSGLIEQQGPLQVQMCCEVFDLFGKYHTDNLCFYRGWKSNNKHRTCGMKLKSTRFILPGHSMNSWQSRPLYTTQELLGDIDRVFYLLDGQYAPDRNSLSAVFDDRFDDLTNGERVSSEYFDLRFHPGIGTIHFFPRRKDLVDRLNRIVGRARQWLPPEEVRVDKAFWLQYKHADEVSQDLRREVNQRAGTSRWKNPFGRIQSPDDAHASAATDTILGALDTVLARRGLVTSLSGPSERDARSSTTMLR